MRFTSILSSSALPVEGEALFSVGEVAAVFGVSAATIWDWSKHEPGADPDVPFPKPVRRGEKFTRWRASELREFIAAMQKTDPKPSPNPNARVAK